jgi:hypothetical protein
MHNWGSVDGAATGTTTGFTTLDGYAQSICGAQPAGAAANGNSVLNWMDCMAGNGRIPGYNVLMDTKTNNDVFGVGLQQDLGGAKFGIDWTYNKSVSTVNLGIPATLLVNAGTGAPTAAGAAVAGWGRSAYPDMETVQQAVEASLLFPIGNQWTIRLMGRYDSFEVKDWHYDNPAAQGTAAGARMADYGPANFSTTTAGVFLKYKM